MVHMLLFLVPILVVSMQFGTLVGGQPQVPCYFIFGDSLVDNGNNNGLNTQAKANYPPYGVDFPQGASGRFTNGRTIADVIGELLGFNETIPPHTITTDQQISRGVNYGSGGSGIRDESGRQLGNRISFNKQLFNHLTTTTRLAFSQKNLTFTNAYLHKCIYIVNTGSSDYINNYFMPSIYLTSRIYTTDQYAAVLIKQYALQLTTLYALGARKVAIFGIGLIGCTPTEIANFGTGGRPCVDSINDAVKLFNDRLKPLVDELNQHLPNANFTYINITSISPPRIVSLVSDAPCCQTRSDGQCTPNTTPCSNRNLTSFYDGIHYTEITNIAVARRSYTAVSPTDAYPYDISQLAQT